MIFIEWFALTVVSFIVDFMGIFVVPVAILFSDGKTLPGWAWPWDNDQEPLGDAARKPDIDAATGVYRGFLRYCWLAWRNPGHNFGYALGMAQAADVTYTFVGDPGVSDQNRSGYLFVLADLHDALCGFCLYLIWPTFPGKCLRVYIGWKISDMVKDGTKAQLVCVVNPFMTFEPK